MMSDDELEAQLPVPAGYHLLIALPQVEETYESGIIKAAKVVHEEHVMSMVGVVLDMGPQAYADKDRFPTGPWCKKGDYILFRPNSGTRFKVAGQEYRLLNDDSVQAVVKDPRGITRAA
jgi:co-chaperonin GroES (HSP10)